jgi:hypothetical protein
MIGEPLCAKPQLNLTYEARSRWVRWQKEYDRQGYDYSTVSEEEEQ